MIPNSSLSLKFIAWFFMFLSNWSFEWRIYGTSPWSIVYKMMPLQCISPMTCYVFDWTEPCFISPVPDVGFYGVVRFFGNHLWRTVARFADRSLCEAERSRKAVSLSKVYELKDHKTATNSQMFRSKRWRHLPVIFKMSWPSRSWSKRLSHFRSLKKHHDTHAMWRV